MTAEHVSSHVDDGAGAEDAGVAPPQEAAIVAVGHEADLLAVRLVGRHQAEPPRVLAHLVLRQIADGKARGGELRLGERPQEVTLVLAAIARAQEREAFRARVALHARVVSGGHRSGVPRARAREQGAELQLAIAGHARDRRAAARIAVGERCDDGPVELLRHVQQVIGNAEALGHAPRVVDGVAAAARAEARGRLVAAPPHAHGDADGLVSGLHEARGGDRGVDAAAHADDDALCAHIAQCRAPSNAVSRSSSSALA